jgi:two-component system KDP operon response regulator KdpE
VKKPTISPTKMTSSLLVLPLTRHYNAAMLGSSHIDRGTNCAARCQKARKRADTASTVRPIENVPQLLIVEDDREIALVRAAFEAEGYRVFEAETLARGVIEAGTRKPDLIVLDLGLPDGDGVALVRDVRGWSSVPIIVLSARVDETDKVTALDAGADDYLVKPFGVA